MFMDMMMTAVMPSILFFVLSLTGIAMYVKNEMRRPRPAKKR